MVLIQLKKNEELLFLYETTTTVATEDLIAQLIDLVNNRLKLLRLASACDDLVEHGPLKPENEWGLSEEQIQSLSLQDGKEKAPENIKEVVKREGREWLLHPDPTGRRTGEAPTEDMADILRRAVSEARSVLSKDVAAANNGLTMAMLTEAEQRIRDAVAVIWPMGLPEYESVREILDGREDLSGTAQAAEVMPADSCLWWAGKEIIRGKTLNDFIGRNEKTKIIAKLAKSGNGAPARENPMNQEAQKQMMAYYYKKQEEHKKLVENDEDEYLNSPWANPKVLKQSFNGIGNVSWRTT